MHACIHTCIHTCMQAKRQIIQPVGMQELLDQIEMANEVKDTLCHDIALRTEELATAKVPNAFWHALKRSGLTSYAPETTLRHSVHLQLQPTATDAQKHAMAQAILRMQYQIPEICEITCGFDAGLASSAPVPNHGFGLSVDFVDAASYQVYATHPAHVAVINDFIKPILVPGSRTAVQFEKSKL